MTTPGDDLDDQAGGVDDKHHATCSECGQVFESQPGDKATAKFKVATHRYNKHGQRADGRKTPKASEPTPDDFGRRPAFSVVASIADAAGAGGKRVPSADDLAKGLGRGLGLVTTGAATFLVETDVNIPEGPDGEKIRDGLVDYLSLPDRAARDVMAPIARILAPTRLNQRYGRGIVDNVDAIGSFAELGILAMHYRAYFRARNLGRPVTAAELDGGASAAAAPPPFERDLASPAPRAGVIVTPETVAAMRAGNS